MARSEYFVGLDVGSSMIRVSVLEDQGGAGLAVVGVGEAVADGMRKGAIASPELTSKTIQKAFFELRKSSGIHVDHAIVSMNDPRMTTYFAKGSVSVSRADGVVTREDIARVMEAAEAALPRLGNREILHSFPLYYSVDRDTRIREPEGLVGSKLEVEALFVAGFTQHQKHLFKAVELAGITVDDAVAAPYAASFHALSKKQKEVGTLVLDIGAHVSSLAVFEEGMITSLEIMPVGSGHITYDIGLGFQIDLASAERVKKNLPAMLEQGKKEIRLTDLPKNFEDTFSPKKLREIVQARLGDIFELVGKHLKRIDRAELLPGGIILTGGGAKLFEIQISARDELRLPADITSGAPGILIKKDIILGPEWVTAVGLGRYAATQFEPKGRLGSLISSSLGGKVGKLLRAFIP